MAPSCSQRGCRAALGYIGPAFDSILDITHRDDGAFGCTILRTQTDAGILDNKNGGFVLSSRDESPRRDRLSHQGAHSICTYNIAMLADGRCNVRPRWTRPNIKAKTATPAVYWPFCPLHVSAETPSSPLSFHRASRNIFIFSVSTPPWGPLPGFLQGAIDGTFFPGVFSISQPAHCSGTNGAVGGRRLSFSPECRVVRILRV